MGVEGPGRVELGGLLIGGEGRDMREGAGRGMSGKKLKIYFEIFAICNGCGCLDSGWSEPAGFFSR